MRTRLLLLVLCLSFGLWGTITADVPRLINYQGWLTDALGQPYSGTVYLNFHLYTQARNPVWSSGFLPVVCTNGLFEVQLGDSLQPPLPSNLWPMDTLLELGIEEHGQVEMIPHTRLVSAPFAFSALHGGGWINDKDNHRMIQEDTTAIVGIGRSDPEFALDIKAGPDGPGAVRIAHTPGGGFAQYGLEIIEGPQSCFSFLHAALFAATSIPSSVAASFCAETDEYGVTISNYGDGMGLYCSVGDGNDSPSILSVGGTGVLSRTNSRAGRFESAYSDTVINVLEVEYTGSGSVNHRAVWARCAPADGWGVGGEFEGGHRGVLASVVASGGTDYVGVVGEVTGGMGLNIGVAGTTTGAGINYGVFGSAADGFDNYAGYFVGPVFVSGFLTKAGGGFRIDHPLDPENKLLQHSFVESPEMKNIYDGVVTTDGNGYAIVTLPDWFGALNDNFRYQLTCIGVFAQAIIADELANNTFTIQTDKPGVKVSWQVTGIRKDAWAQANPMDVELDKRPDQRGKYLTPDAFGVGPERALYPVPDQTEESLAKIRAYEESKAARARKEAEQQPPAPFVQPTRE